MTTGEAKAKTIFMSREQHEKWDKALRSGEYQQGQERLERDGKYCCLGVLQHCLTGEVEMEDWDGVLPDLPNLLPSLMWLNKHNIRFTDYGGDTHSAPTLYVSEGFPLTADALNDGSNPIVGQWNFIQLADAIKDHVEYI